MSTPGRLSISAAASGTALRDLRAARRSRRLADIDWVDSLYRVYVSVGVVGFLVWYVAETLGDRQVGASDVATVAARGSGFLGVAIAVLLATALRSGRRGGPLAIEAPDLHYVLQSPVDRRRALLRPYVHQLRRGVYVGAMSGVIAGRLAVPFLSGSLLGWLVTGAAAGAALGLLWMGVAAIASGVRLRALVTTGAGTALVAWAAGDALGGWRSSPMALAGSLLVAPVRDSVVVSATVVGIGALLAVAGGFAVLGGVRPELALRRAELIGQLRFAVTTQDLRAVLLLRRQLGSEHLRRRPWFRVSGRPGPGAAVVVRSVRGIARWPVTRIIRSVVLAVVAGAAARGAWEGALPLVVVAGLAAFVAGLDAVEALSQDADHPDRLASIPRHRGRMASRQVMVPAVLMAMLGVVSAASAAVTGLLAGVGAGGWAALVGALAVGVVGGVGGAIGAAISVAMGPPSLATMLMIPELALLRTMTAPALSVLAVGLPLLLARIRVERGQGPGIPHGLALLALLGYGALAWLTNGGIREPKASPVPVPHPPNPEVSARERRADQGKAASILPLRSDVAGYGLVMDVLVVDCAAPTAPADFVRSLRTTGFAVLHNHSLPTALVEQVHDEWYRFYRTDAKYKYPFTEQQDGYYAPDIAETAKGATVRDLKEFFHVYPWGQYPAEVSDAALRLREAGSNLAIELLGWVQAETPEEVLAGLSMPLPNMLDGSARTMLRVLHYPPLRGDEVPGAVRAAAHEDINLLTVLPGSHEPGLQVLDLAGNWHDVPANPGTVVVNAGDMLQWATGGHYPSTTHRVVNPVGEGRFRSRMSTPLFLHPADAVVLAEGRTAFEFLQDRIRILRGLDVK